MRPCSSTGCQGSRSPELGPHLLVTARRDDNQLCARFDPAADCVVRGGVASVQGDQRIDGRQLGAFDGACGKLQSVRANLPRQRVGRNDQLLAHLDANHFHGSFPHPRKQVPQAKRQIPLATSHVDDGWTTVPALRPSAVFRQMRENLQVSVDLGMFVGHGGANVASVIQDTQTAEPIARGIIENRLSRPVVSARWRFGFRGLVSHKLGGSRVIHEQLPIPLGCVEQRTAEPDTNLLLRPDRRLIQRHVLRDIAGWIAKCE